MHKYRCCRTINQLDSACIREYVSPDKDGKIKCQFQLDGELSTSDVFEGYIESCLGSSTNKITLTYECSEPEVGAVKLVKDMLHIDFKKASVKSSNAACQHFKFINR